MAKPRGSATGSWHVSPDERDASLMKTYRGIPAPYQSALGFISAEQHGLGEMFWVWFADAHRPIRLAGSAAVVVGCAYVTREVSLERRAIFKRARR